MASEFEGLVFRALGFKGFRVSEFMVSEFEGFWGFRGLGLTRALEVGLWRFEGFRAEELKLLAGIIEALSSVGAYWAFGVC